jgi:hypothetical protein
MDQTLATRITATATAAAISLAGTAWALHTAPSARAAAGSTAPAPVTARAAVASAVVAPATPIPFSVADPETWPRPVITVTIAGVPLLLLLDTGSTGIRISADKVPAGAVTVTGTASPYGYGSGVRLHGDQADADVAIGGYHTGRLPIELVRSTDCFPDKPACPAAHGAKPAMFGGVLDGVMGVSLEAATGLVNPMWTLQDAAGNHVGRQFAVRFTPEQFSGEVLLDVPAAGYGLVQLPPSPVAKAEHTHSAVPQAGDARTAAERYASYHSSYAAARTPAVASRPAAGPADDAPTSWNPRAVQTCLSGAGLPTTCAPAMFDSGTPNLALDVAGAVPGTWPAGRALDVTVPQAGWSQAFTSGPGTGVTVTDTASADTGGSLLGLPAFARGPIRFDLTAGTIGFPVPDVPARPVPSSRSLPQGTAAPALTPAPAPVSPQAPAQPAAAPPQNPASQPAHPAPKAANDSKTTSPPRLPFHQTARKAARLPDTGVPMSAALGAVTALTALLAGIGTVLAARRRTDREI